MLSNKQQTSQLSSLSVGTANQNGQSAFAKNGLLISSALALGLLVGCGGGSESTETTTTADTAAETTTAEPAEVEVPEAETPEVEAAPEAEEVEATEVAEAEPEVEAAAAATDDAPLDANAGAELYEKTCKTCHATGLLSSPKLGDKEAWAPRIAQGKETLYKHSAEGFNQMPPQAAGDVTEAQVHAAVDYMVEQSS